jgi:hypothetical protein
LLPASGSVIANENRSAPLAIAGSHRSRCSGVPCLAMITPATPAVIG